MYIKIFTKIWVASTIICIALFITCCIYLFRKQNKSDKTFKKVKNYIKVTYLVVGVSFYSLNKWLYLWRILITVRNTFCGENFPVLSFIHVCQMIYCITRSGRELYWFSNNTSISCSGIPRKWFRGFKPAFLSFIFFILTENYYVFTKNAVKTQKCNGHLSSCYVIYNLV